MYLLRFLCGQEPVCKVSGSVRSRSGFYLGQFEVQGHCETKEVNVVFKGTLTRDFLPLVFFVKTRPPIP